MFSNNPTIANEPNIPLNSKSLTSNLFTPQRGDFIVYNFNDKYLGNHKRMHRLIGNELDTVEIRLGVVFVNGKNFDENLNLSYYYETSKENYVKIQKLDFNIENLFIERIDSSNIKFLMDKNNAAFLPFKSKKLVENKNSIDIIIQSKYHKPWNKDNFGPIVVPKNKVFVLGDNRDFTLDSRIEGFINKNDIKGKLIKVF